MIMHPNTIEQIRKYLRNKVLDETYSYFGVD